MDLVRPIAKLNENSDAKTQNRVFYRCQKPEGGKFGINDDGVIIVGLALVPYCVTQHDFVEEEVAAAGNEASLILPDEVTEGMILEAIVTNVSRDWESGNIDSCDVKLKPVTDPSELMEIAALKAELEGD